MRRFEDLDRFNFDLTPDSLVIDGGCYMGQWANAISGRYDCHIISYEPCVRWFFVAGQVLKDRPKVILVNAGLGASMRRVEFGVQNDSTGAFAAGVPRPDGTFERETVQILDGVREIRKLERPIDLLKLNIENMEYEFLEHVLAEGAAPLLRTIIVQPHTNAPDYQERWAAISTGLHRTHNLTACVEFVWEKWERK
jgi:FkbM family methyltransferase